MTESSDDGHFATFEDVQTGALYTFGVGRAKGFHYIGGRLPPPALNPPSETSQGYHAAEAAARSHFRAEGLI